MSGIEVVGALTSMEEVVLCLQIFSDQVGPGRMSFIELRNEYDAVMATLIAVGGLVSENGMLNSQYEDRTKGTLERAVKGVTLASQSIQVYLDSYSNQLGPGRSRSERSLAKIRWDGMSKLVDELRTHNCLLGSLLNLVQMHVVPSFTMSLLALI